MPRSRSWLASLFAALAFAAGLASARAAQPAEHIVLFKPEMPLSARRKLVESSGATVIKELPFIDGLLVRLPEVAPKTLQTLQTHPKVETIEENAYRRWIEAAPAVDWDSRAADRPGEGFFGPLPPFRFEEPAPPKKAAELPWGVARVKAPAAWQRTKGRGVKVAVIDTGIDSSHPDLAPNYAGGFNALNPAAPPMDDQGHGTHVAGTIAAAANNLGVVGVAPEASLYAVKVLDENGGGTPATIVEGIEWAARNKMDVVNMSLGGPFGSSALRRAVTAAAAAGVTIVAASGNDPKQPVGVPARYPETIAVSASSSQDRLAFFSTTGPEVDFIAPGMDIISDAPGAKLAMHSGTSMATPHVTGLAALAIAAGARGPAQVRAALEKAAVPLPGLAAEEQGAGLIEADRLR